MGKVFPPISADDFSAQVIQSNTIVGRGTPDIIGGTTGRRERWSRRRPVPADGADPCWVLQGKVMLCCLEKVHNAEYRLKQT